MTVLFFFISLFASTIGAISGIGGGVIIKPVLDATGLLSVSTISFLSSCTVLTMTCVSLFRTRNNGVVLKRDRSTSLALGAVLGGTCGKWLFDWIRSLVGEENTIGAIQAATLLAITAVVFVYVRRKKYIRTHEVKHMALCFTIGTVLGLFSAFLGIGGGPINIAILYFFFSMDAKTSAKNSLYIILFSQVSSLVLTLITGSVPEFSPLTLLVMASGGVIGALIGSSIVKRVEDDTVEKIFIGLMMLIMLINVYNILRFTIF